MKCCIGTDIRLVDEDIARWERENRLDILLAINPHFGGSRQLIKKHDNDECIFLLKDGRCKINGTKPYICKIFPQSQKQADVFECSYLIKESISIKKTECR
jgi:Fe-S-cluster containining protein